MSPHGNSESADVHQLSSTPSPISLASVLSATSYPIPEPCISESNTTQDAETCLYGGILLSSCRQPQGNNKIHSLDESPLYENATASLDSNTSQEEHQTNAKSSTPANAKRGRPRKIAKDLSVEELAQLRRLQNRQAQRSYRYRKEASISVFKARVLQLETAVQNMNSVIYLFSEELTKCEMFESNSILAGRLNTIVEKYLSLAGKISLESEEKSGECLQ